MKIRQSTAAGFHRPIERADSSFFRLLIQIFCVLIFGCMAYTAQGVSSGAAHAKLENARENLRISQATEKRIASELEQLKQSGNTAEDVIKDYEIYLERVQAMVAENQKIVRDMEAAYIRYLPPKKVAGSQPSNEMEKMLDPNIPEQQTVDEVAALDRELNASLSEFDEKLLKEMDLIKAKSANRMQDLAEEAADAAKRLREKGVDLDSSSDEPAEPGADETDDGEKADTDKDSADKQDGQTVKAGGDDGQVAKSDTSGKGDQGAARKQGRHGSGEDDDIVARQLREAAENETDPELKEKLWKEYEEYKKNTGN